jgi:transposase
MKKEQRLVNKVKRLLARAGLPRHLNRLGPKKFRLWQLSLGLLIKEVFRLSYRRAMRFLDEFYGIHVHWTTLQKFRQRLPLSFWHHLLASTNLDPIAIAAIDGTALQRHNPSMHYLKRIDRTAKISVPLYINVLVDVVRRKFVSVRHHAAKSGELRDVKYLVERALNDIDLLLLDKLYDSEKMHSGLRERGILSIAPVKKNWARGQLRKQLKDCFDYVQYWQRNLVESLFSALKRLFGSQVRCQTARTQRAEIFMRMIAYNLGARKILIFY